MKAYKITVAKRSINILLNELNAWMISASKYEVDGNTIITQDFDVIDVATETFIKAPHLIEIKEIKND